MKNYLPKKNRGLALSPSISLRVNGYKKPKGFTLIELMVTISILAILSVTGAVVYTSTQKNVRDARRKADIETIANAYEMNYKTASKYSVLTSGQFEGDTIPTPPEGGEYYNVRDDLGSGFKVCAALEAHPQRTCNSDSTTCFCKSSTRQDISGSGSYSGFGSDLGLGESTLSHNSPAGCDPNQILDDGLIGYWNFNEGSGSTTTADLSGKGNHGVLNNNPTWNSGHFGSFLSFLNDAGQLQSVRIQNLNTNNTFNFNNNISWTISLWVRSNDTDPLGSTQKRMIGRDLDASTGASYWWLDWNRGRPLLELSDSSGTSCGSLLTVGTNIANGNWHHVVFIINRTQATKTYYVDYTGTGGQTNSNTMGTCTGNFNSALLSKDVRIAYQTGNPTYHYTGDIDDVRIYNKALTAQEVSLLYNDTLGCVPN